MFFTLFRLHYLFWDANIDRRLYTNRPHKVDDKKKIQILQILFSVFAILVFFFYSIDPDKDRFFVYEELMYVNLILIILIIINFLFLKKDRNQDIIIFIYKNKINFFLVLGFLIIYIGNSVSFYN